MADFNRSEDARNGMALGSEAAAAVARQAETWASAQCELLSGVEAMWIGWMQRRREALDASTRSLTQICESRDLGDILQIQQQWFADTVQRTASDLSAFANDAAASQVHSSAKPAPPWANTCSLINLTDILAVLVAGEAAVHRVASLDHLGEVPPEQAAPATNVARFDAVLPSCDPGDQMARDGQIAVAAWGIHGVGQRRRG